VGSGPPADGDAGAAFFTDLAAGALDYVETAWYQIR
jgi:hypothetical protein